jgi:cysteine desulfurase
VDRAAISVRHAVDKLRELSPLWDMYQDGIDLDTIEWAAH